MTPTIARLPPATCVADLRRDARLAQVVLAAVVVRGVDDEPLGELRAAQLRQRARDAGSGPWLGAPEPPRRITWPSGLPVVCRIAGVPLWSTPAKECVAAAARTASTATWTLPSVRFLKPTGIDRPEPSWRWIWLSVVRAPIAAHETVSEMYCGVIGSRNSQPTGRPRRRTSSSSSRAARTPASTSPEPSRCGSLMRPFQPGRGARLLEVHAHGDEQLVLVALGLGAQPAGVLQGGIGVVHAAGADDDEQPVVDPVEDRLDLGAAAQDEVGHLGFERQVLEQVGRRRQRRHARDARVAHGAGLDHAACVAVCLSSRSRSHWVLSKIERLTSVLRGARRKGEKRVR